MRFIYFTKEFIIGTNLKENIAFGENEEEIDYEKLGKAIKQAKIENLVKNKGGVDFEIKDDGKNLSGGQSREYYWLVHFIKILKS